MRDRFKTLTDKYNQKTKDDIMMFESYLTIYPDLYKYRMNDAVKNTISSSSLNSSRRKSIKLTKLP